MNLRSVELTQMLSIWDSNTTKPAWSIPWTESSNKEDKSKSNRPEKCFEIKPSSNRLLLETDLFKRSNHCRFQPNNNHQEIWPSQM